MANPDFTIKVTVDRSGPKPVLKYTASGFGGFTNSAKSHGIFRDTDLNFDTDEPFLLIQFKGATLPFASKGAGVSVEVKGGVQNPALKTRKLAWGPTTRYTAIVVTREGEAIWEDPELEDGGDPGGV